MVGVALVGHGAYCFVVVVVVVELSLVVLGGVEAVLSEFELLAPLGVTLPLADIDPVVEVSADGVVEMLVLLLGDEVSVEAVVVVVVELGVALVPELL